MCDRKLSCIERTPAKLKILAGDSYARQSLSFQRLLSVTGVRSVWEELLPSHTLVNSLSFKLHVMNEQNAHSIAILKRLAAPFYQRQITIENN
jgi:hypothetical protein